MLAVTATFNVAFAVRVPSLAWSVKLPAVALGSATMSAVTVPPVFTILDSVTPFRGICAGHCRTHTAGTAFQVPNCGDHRIGKRGTLFPRQAHSSRNSRHDVCDGS